MRIIIDTNVFVSGLMLPASMPGRILRAAIAGDFEIVLCEAMLEEISAALHYPKVRKRISLSD
jgi:putative PIN family toxin of toxin-antitoxin system